MTVTELIDALVVVREQVGDVPVLHQNDWTTFLVDRLELEPARDGTDPIQNCRQPIHAVIYGESQFYDCETGELTKPRL
jgi:hypothetical protein